MAIKPMGPPKKKKGPRELGSKLLESELETGAGNAYAARREGRLKGGAAYMGESSAYEKREKVKDVEGGTRDMIRRSARNVRKNKASAQAKASAIKLYR